MPTARTYFEAFGKDAGKEIYQAVTSVWYALDFYRRFFNESGNKRPKAPKERRTNFLHSVFVYKGTLVVADRLEDHYQLSEEPHVMLRTIDCLTNKSLPFGSDGETIIDVVREDYLEEYLLCCREDVHLCADHLKEVASAEWITGEMKAKLLLDDR